MKTEEKQLILKDLCGRLPYSPLVYLSNSMEGFDSELNTAEIEFLINNEYMVKPYLFPLSSMTEEQKIECFRGTDIGLNNYNEIWSKFSITIDNIIITSIKEWLKVIDYLNANHFDYRGLIEKGLAIDATNLNIY